MSGASTLICTDIHQGKWSCGIWLGRRQPGRTVAGIVCVSLQSGVGPPLIPQPLGVVQERVLDVLPDLVEELLPGLHAIQVH